MTNINSSINKENERSIEFQTINQKGEETIQIFDLNKMFQVSFSYNFELLKNIMEAIINNQQNIQNDFKEKQTQILNLETQLLEIKTILGAKGNLALSSDGDKEVPTNPKLFSVIKGNQDILRPPPNDIKLEVSVGNDDIINQIIVSNIKTIM
jgi:hypothetical protein